jgi:membrane protein implicated in regulation of membrane protease activity
LEEIMQDHLVWTILGFVLVIVELMTGTFYLLVLGVGALVAALAAWMGAPFLVQVAVAGVVASIGTWWIQKWHARQRKEGDQSNALDVGQMVTLVGWINQPEGMLRVKYRGAEWDARIKPGDLAAAGMIEGGMLYILAQDGQCWVVGAAKPPRDDR